MSIKSDHWIRRMADSHGMIEPFEPGQVRTANGGRIVSYGTSSYGYDVRCAREFKIFTNINSTIVDPKDFDPNSFVDFTGEIGRWGVARATDRDVDAVKRVLACDLAIKEYAIQLAELGAGKLTKKLEAVATNTKKMEATLYELTLSAASGDRRMLLSSVEEPPAPDGGRGGGADGDDGNNNAEQ